jgi:hypothetical protein
LIGFILSNAVNVVQRGSTKPNIALFSEIPIEHDDLPGIGPVGGAVDFLTSTIAGGYTSVREFGDKLVPAKPYFVVVEAKKSSTIADQSSQAQLLAQLLTLEYMDW